MGLPVYNVFMAKTEKKNINFIMVWRNFILVAIQNQACFQLLKEKEVKKKR